MVEGIDLTRREFMIVGSSSLLSIDSGRVRQQVDSSGNNSEYQFQGVADLMGPRDARPEPGDEFFDDKIAYAYRYEAQDTAERFFLQDGDQSWTRLKPPVTLEKLPHSDVPTTTDAPTGEMLLLDETRTPIWNGGNAWETATFTDDVLLQDQTVADTTTETTVYTDDVDAGSLLTGRVLSTRVMGNFSTVNNSDTFDLRFYVEGGEVAAISNIGQNVSGAPLSAQMYLTVRDGGDGGTISAHTLGRVNESISDQNQQTQTLNLTGASTVEVTIQWGAADPGNEVVITQAMTAQRNFDYNPNA